MRKWVIDFIDGARCHDGSQGHATISTVLLLNNLEEVAPRDLLLRKIDRFFDRTIEEDQRYPGTPNVDTVWY